MPISALHRWRAALRIAAALANVRPAVCLTLPHAAWRDIGRRFTHYDTAVAHDWARAVAHLREQLHTRLRWLQTDLQTVLDDLAASGTEAPPTVPFLVAELAALEEEFPSVTLDLAASTLTVQTEPIVLEGRVLGPFALIGHWERLPQEDFLEVRALEPRHPDDRDDVTHPHVLDDRLCEGAAAGALRQALAAGRLSDYFEIARRTLATYNPRSAYVTLSEWEGRSCARCGDRVAASRLSDCPHCEEACCSDCDNRCDACDDPCCSGCLAVCRACGTRACPDCIVDGPVRCPTCALPPDDEEPLHVEAEETTAVVTAPPHSGELRDLAAADAALHAPGVGQTLLAARSG